ncbi:nucleotide-binding universal stress UspA family protein [Paraburkholderia sp. Clong3]
MRICASRSLQLAHRFHARLTGLFSSYVPPRHAFFVIAGTADYSAEHERQRHEHASALERLFHAELARAKIDGQWIATDGYANDVVPPGRHVLIAWDGSREATRAIHDALPYLAHAAKVSLLTVHSPTDQPPRDRLPGADIALTVARHGVKIDLRELSVESDTPVGDALLSQADELGCDMIVMGTHGRRGFRRLVLGSVAERSASCPVLLIPASANGATADPTAPALAEKELTCVTGLCSFTSTIAAAATPSSRSRSIWRNVGMRT